MKWNVRTLKEYVDDRFKENRRAIKLARKLMNSRLNLMNNIHHQLVDQNKTFVSKMTYDIQHENLSKKVEGLQRDKNIMLGIILVINFIIEPLLFYFLSK